MRKLERYRSIFESEEKTCDCTKCSESDCERRDMDQCNESELTEGPEGCPEGTTPKSGGCMNADKNSYRQKACDKDYTWDSAAGSTGKCVHVPPAGKHQPRSER